MAINDFGKYALLASLPEKTVKVIENIRESPPSRKVRSGRNNVPGKYPSVKMGVSIQFESRTLELANIIMKEHNPSVLEYYDQPPSFAIQYMITDKNGKERNSGGMYTPDTFVIEENWIGWEECKMEDDLFKLAIETPNRYLLDDEGIWRCPPAEEYANNYGLSFRVITDKHIDRSYLRNINFLEDYLLSSPLLVDLKINNAIIEVVKSNPGIRLDSLINDYAFEADHIYISLIYNHIYIDLYKHVLADAHNVEVYLDKFTATAYSNMRSVSVVEREINFDIVNIEPGNVFEWNGRHWTFINIGETFYSLMSEQNKLMKLPINIFAALLKEGEIKGLNAQAESENDMGLEILRMASKEQLEMANKRFNYVMSTLNHEEVTDVPERTLNCWVKNYKDAEIKYGNGFIGLIDDRSSQGNRVPRYSKKVLEIIEKYISEYYETFVQRNRSIVYKLMLENCTKNGLTPPSYRTFCNMIKSRSTHEQTRKRKGTKAAYKTEGFYWELDRGTPRHGDRPFEIVHIDHTGLDIEIVCSRTGKNLGRPWATFLVYTRRKCFIT